MKFNLSIDMDHAAFKDGPELADLLEIMADRARVAWHAGDTNVKGCSGSFTSAHRGTVKNSRGENVGTYSFTQ